MKYILTIFLAYIISVSFAQNPIWSVGTAKTIPKRQYEISIFEPARYGLTNSVEIGAHPLAFFAIPHIYLKKMWLDKTISKESKFMPNRRFMVATLHGINYPTILLNFVKNRGIRNLLPQDSVISGILAFRNELLISTFLSPRTSCDAENYLLTWKLGIKNALDFGKVTAPPIDRSILYRETVIYQKKIVWYTGLDLDAYYNERVNYSLDFDFYSVGKFEKMSVEHKGMVIWHFTDKLRGMLGYKVAFGTTDTGSKFLFMPLFDLTWCLKRSSGSNLNKFDKNMFNPDDDRD